jgi:hypothetical protein
MRYHLLPVGMTVVKSQKITSVRKNVEKRESLYTVGGNIINSVVWWEVP